MEEAQSTDECVCRICGWDGDDVAARVKLWSIAENTPTSSKEALRLCDFCACIGKLCAGADGYHQAGMIPTHDLMLLLHTLVEKIDDARRGPQEAEASKKVSQQPAGRPNKYKRAIGRLEAVANWTERNVKVMNPQEKRQLRSKAEYIIKLLDVK